MLINAQTLAQHLDDPSWAIFDCRHDLMDLAKGERLYREGHIPGAHFASLDVDLSGEKTGTNGRHPLPPPASFVAFLARHGVSNQTTVVAYDDVGGQFAARLWWLCRWVGLQQVALLDGGISKWVDDGRTLSNVVPRPTVATLAGHANAAMVITAAELLPCLPTASAPGRILIDARPPQRYRGEVEPLDPVAGHIPGAINHFCKENLNSDLTFKSQDDLRKIFMAMLGSASPADVVHQCGSGVTACANLFAMEHAGLKGSSLYAGSWSEWVSDTTRPVKLGADK
ncbi:MAG: sulfurtransferase [Pseudomonadota bacterium]